MPGKRRPTLMGGLIWTGLGMMFLLRNFNVVSDLWGQFARYWPVLLILLGLGKVVDYFRRKEGVSLRVGEVFGIIILVFIGSLVTRISNSRFRDIIRDLPVIQVGDERVGIGEWLGNSHTFSEESTYPVPASQPLRVENSYGNVTVSPGVDTEIRVRIQKKVYADEEPEAKRISGEITLQGGTDAGIFVVKTNRDDLASRNYRFRTDLELMVPKRVQLQVRNSYGDVRVTNLDGKLDLNTSHKQLEVRDCSAEVTAVNRYGGSRFFNLTGKLDVDARGRVDVEQVKGDVVIRNEYSPVQLKAVDGQVSVINTEGSIHLEDVSKPVVIDARGSNVTVSNLAESLKVTASHRRVQISDVGPVTIDSRYSNLSLKDVRGNIELQSESDRITAEDLKAGLTVRGRGSSLRVDSVAGPLDATTSRKDVIVNEFGGPCKITNEYGDVTVSSSHDITHDVTVKNRNGAIEVFLPEDASFQIDATARNGRADSDFKGIVPVEATGDTGTLRGKTRSGGARISLETEYSDIRVRVREGNPAQRSALRTKSEK